MQETQVWSLGWEDPLEKEMATHSSTLAWKIPQMEEPGRLQPMWLQRARHDWAISLSCGSSVYVSARWLFYVLSHLSLVQFLMDCSLPGSSVHGILQLRILSWVAIPGDLPHPGTELSSSTSPALQTDYLLLSHWVSPPDNMRKLHFKLLFNQALFFWP